MKKLIILTLCFTTLLITGCEKSIFDLGRPGYIKYDGAKYALEEGYITDDGTGIVLISEGIVVSGNGTEYYQGKGSLMLCNGLVANADKTPKEDSYDLTELEGGIGINYEFEEDVYDYLSDFETIKNGTVEIAKKGDKYEITMEFTDEEDNKVECYFKGELRTSIQ